MIARIVQTLGSDEGSTRPAALMRIGLALLLWTRFGRFNLLFATVAPDTLLIGTAFWVGTLGMLFGVFSRTSTAMAGIATFGGLYHYLGFGQDVTEYLHHHTYLLAIATCCLALTPCGGSYSWDRWRAVRRAEREGVAPPPERGDLWGVRLIAVQLSVIYFWGAWDKCNPAFLDGSRMEQIYMFLYFGSDYPDGGWFHPLMVGLSWSTVVLEFFLCFAFFVRRWLWWTIPVGLIFHAIIYYTLTVGTFTATMWLLYLAYLDPDAVHRFIDRLSGHGDRAVTG